MSQSHAYVFVLWADQFEEVPATIFVTELRAAGLRVKVVGLTPRPISGSHGLALVPDLTLDQALALAPEALCLVIPQTAAGLLYLTHDPRLQQFFDLAGKNQARLVMGAFNGTDLSRLKLFSRAVIDQIWVYPQTEELLEFTQRLIRLLQRG